MRYLGIAAALLLSGCAMFDGPVPIREAMTVRITLTDSLPPDYNGYATWAGDQCDIVLRRSTYPRCMQHEVRHCFEGDFHRNAPSSEDCFDH